MERSEVWTVVKQLEQQFQSLRVAPPNDQDYRTCQWLYVELLLLMISMRKSLEVYRRRHLRHHVDVGIRESYFKR